MVDRAARDGNLFRRGGCAHQCVGAALVFAGFLLACGKSPPPTSRPKQGPGIGPVMGTIETLENSKPVDPGLPVPSPLTADPVAEAAPEEQQKPAEEKPARDYPSELLQRVGNPASCLAPRLSDGNLRPIKIDIAVQLMPSGAVARTELNASELSGGERACLSQRVGAVRLDGPIEGAPLGVRASLTLQPSAAKPGAAPAAKPADKGMAAEPGQGPEPSTFLEPSPEAKEVPPAKEVPAAPPVEITGEGTTP